jgi:DNA-binding helix-hairpin-helix protein with protein kinase domain
MKKGSLIMLVAAVSALTITAFTASNAEESKSVAWYAANIQEAKTKVQACHDNASLQGSPECLNARHALEISFGVGSK